VTPPVQAVPLCAAYGIVERFKPSIIILMIP
jgi:hypothetical protein